MAERFTFARGQRYGLVLRVDRQPFAFPGGDGPRAVEQILADTGFARPHVVRTGEGGEQLPRWALEPSMLVLATFPNWIAFAEVDFEGETVSMRDDLGEVLVVEQVPLGAVTARSASTGLMAAAGAAILATLVGLVWLARGA